MKRSLYIVLAALMALSSCDIIEQPVITQKSAFRGDLYEVPEFDPNMNNQKNVLLEDFTGHLCGNCPGATLVAEDIIAEHGADRVVAVALHASSLANPIPIHPNDFRTEYGDRQWSLLAATTLPNGRVDRSPDESVPYSPNAWAEAVTARLGEAADVKLQIKTEFVPEAGHLNVHVETAWINSLDDNARLQLLIVESDIEEYQLNFASTGNPEYDSPDAYDYIHNHMLRDDVNGLFGNQFNTTNAGDVSVHSFTYKWNTSWDIENTDIVAFVTSETDGEVHNVTHAHAK